MKAQPCLLATHESAFMFLPNFGRVALNQMIFAIEWLSLRRIFKKHSIMGIHEYVQIGCCKNKNRMSKNSRHSSKTH